MRWGEARGSPPNASEHRHGARPNASREGHDVMLLASREERGVVPAVSGTQLTSLVDDEVVTNTPPLRDSSVDQLSYGGDIETSSDDEVVESESTNAPQPNIFSIANPHGIQLEVDLSSWFNTSSPQSEFSTSTETEWSHSTTDYVVLESQGHHMVQGEIDNASEGKMNSISQTKQDNDVESQMNGPDLGITSIPLKYE
ncbi:hypothetical protein HAX54_004098 [Datura stramonium]|uniref:Uncharacterized protein n=1 Tax=Datura stramonium TaxID=4076 RepID=A0ABS8T763_DATST|nr:hypothetical protein [Datura stramonium]